MMTGGGSSYPDSPMLEWNGSCECMRQMARIDFLRGLQKDDLYNVVWDSWARHIQFLHGFPPGARAQWMESMVGVSYAAASDQVRLRAKKCRLEFIPPVRRELACDMWAQFVKMGLQAN
eukprot:12409042-Karenia_brevis.AAC.1